MSATSENSDNTASAPSRFELLAGRFFDGTMSDAEDREFAEMLSADRTQAKFFLRQMEVERCLIVFADPQRISNGVFAQAIQHSVHLLTDKNGTERFAKQVLTLIRNASSSRRRPAIPLRRKTLSVTPWIAAASLAAVVAFAILLTRPTPAPNAPLSNNGNNPEPVPVFASREAVVDIYRQEIAPASPSVPAHDEHQPPVPKQTEFANTDEIEPFFPDMEFAVEEIQPAPQIRPSPPNPPVVAKAPINSRPETATIVELGRVSHVSGCTAVLRRAGVAGGEMAVRRQEILGDGDLLRVGPSDASPSDTRAMNAGCELRLADGTQLRLKPNSTLRMQRIDGALRPLLETGEVRAQVAPQSGDKPFAILTKQGTEARVLGTVFSVQAEPQNRRVMLYVEEGRVLFKARNEERIVLADEACLAEDGKGPTLPYQYRPRPGVLAGAVIDREKNTPVANATVTVAPVAQRGGAPIQFKTQTDAAGKYAFDALPDGPVFVYVVTEQGESQGIRGRATVTRARIESGTKTSLNIPLDYAILVRGWVTENSKSTTDYRVRLVRQNSDGLSFNAAKSGSVLWNMGNELRDGYSFIAMDGAGRYTPIVEKKGMIAKFRGRPMLDLRSDRENSWNIDTTFTPSAILQGRVMNSAGASITEEAGAKADDPRKPRSIVTLQSSTGQLQAALAGPDGEFLFDTNLETGTYELRVERFGFQPDVRRVNLVAGKTLETAVALKTAQPAYRK